MSHMYGLVFFNKDMTQIKPFAGLFGRAEERNLGNGWLTHKNWSNHSYSPLFTTVL